MKTSRENRSLIALLMGWCLFFNIFAWCLHHGQSAGAVLGGVSVAYCSLAERADLLISLSDAPAGAGNLASALGCPLCVSGAVAETLPAGWRTVWFSPVSLAGAVQDSQLLPIGILPWPSANPRAPPSLS